MEQVYTETSSTDSSVPAPKTKKASRVSLAPKTIANDGTTAPLAPEQSQPPRVIVSPTATVLKGSLQDKILDETARRLVETTRPSQVSDEVGERLERMEKDIRSAPKQAEAAPKARSSWFGSSSDTTPASSEKAPSTRKTSAANQAPASVASATEREILQQYLSFYAPKYKLQTSIDPSDVSRLPPDQVKLKLDEIRRRANTPTTLTDSFKAFMLEGASLISTIVTAAAVSGKIPLDMAIPEFTTAMATELQAGTFDPELDQIYCEWAPSLVMGPWTRLFSKILATAAKSKQKRIQPVEIRKDQEDL